jgi:hypothetical protein
VDLASIFLRVARMPCGSILRQEVVHPIVTVREEHLAIYYHSMGMEGKE